MLAAAEFTEKFDPLTLSANHTQVGTHSGPSMSDNQSAKTEKKRSTPRYIATVGAIATVLAIFNLMSNGSEAQSQPVVVLEYVALTLGLFALVGGLTMMMTQKSNTVT
jgi:hypothetical protein